LVEEGLQIHKAAAIKKKGWDIGTRRALSKPMDLYDVKARGFQGPLNSREIERLFRAGIVTMRQPCKPKGEAKWLTIDEVFPGLKYKVAARPLRFHRPSQARSQFKFVSAAAVIALFFGVTVAHTWVRNSAKRANLPSRQTESEAPKLISAWAPAVRPGDSFEQAAQRLDQAVTFRDNRQVR
jgi:hypothetical protein